MEERWKVGEGGGEVWLFEEEVCVPVRVPGSSCLMF